MPGAKTKTIPACLEPLVRYASGLTERFSVADLRKRLEALDICVDDLADYAIADDNGYRRNLIYECDMADFLLLYWKSGQRSPIHNHAGSTCGFKVLKGTGMETVFDMTRVDAWLDPIGGEAFREALRRIEQELFDADWSLAKQTHGDEVSVDKLWRLELAEDVAWETTPPFGAGSTCIDEIDCEVEVERAPD